MSDSIYSSDTMKGKSKKEIEETVQKMSEHLIKSLIVTFVAAYDRYFTDRFIEAFIPYIRTKTVSPDFGKFLENCGLDVHETFNLLNHSKPRIRIKSLLVTKLENHVTQTDNSINKLYKFYGIKDFLNNAQKKQRKNPS